MSFTDVMIRLSDGEKIKTLSSILEFPTTESLKNDYGRPIKTIDAEKFELNNIIDSVKESTLLNQMKAAEEIEVVLHNLNSLNKTMHLDYFDNIQINRNGVSLFRIVLPKNQSRKSVIIDIARYHKDCLRIFERNRFVIILAFICFFILFTGLFIYRYFNEIFD